MWVFCKGWSGDKTEKAGIWVVWGLSSCLESLKCHFIIVIIIVILIDFIYISDTYNRAKVIKY